MRIEGGRDIPLRHPRDIPLRHPLPPGKDTFPEMSREPKKIASDPNRCIVVFVVVVVIIIVFVLLRVMSRPDIHDLRGRLASRLYRRTLAVSWSKIKDLTENE